MGAGGGIKASLPIPLILKRMDECIIPEERESVFDYLEMLDTKLKSGNPKQSTIFKDAEGVQALFKIWKSMLKDPTAATLLVQVFTRCKTKVNVIMDFLQFGGLLIIDRKYLSCLLLLLFAFSL
jgi:hypothetical protein